MSNIISQIGSDVIADMTFTIGSGELIGLGGKWTATSGTSSLAPLKTGFYTAQKGSLMTGQPGYGVGVDPKYSEEPYRYRDKKGFDWFLWLGEGNLGLHPDGNVVGTLGCIGVQDDDTSDLFDRIKEKITRKSLTFRVA